MSGGQAGPCDCTYDNGAYTCFADPNTGAGRYVRPACPPDASTGESCGYAGGQCMFCSDGVGNFCSCSDGGLFNADGSMIDASGSSWMCSPVGGPTCQGP